jgi:hypothetical protein
MNYSKKLQKINLYLVKQRNGIHTISIISLSLATQTLPEYALKKIRCSMNSKVGLKYIKRRT